jgi:hypothetical protein
MKTMKKTQVLGMRRKQNKSDKALEARWRAKDIALTVAQYNALLEDQNFCCAICDKHEDMFRHGLGIDHDHFSGEVRGLLCVNCNALLGHAKDRIDTLERAIKYLSRELSLESIAGEI